MLPRLPGFAYARGPASQCAYNMTFMYDVYLSIENWITRWIMAVVHMHIYVRLLCKEAEV